MVRQTRRRPTPSPRPPLPAELRRRKTPSWSDLSEKLILCISQLLMKTRSDILSFRGVCKKWRQHSTPPPPNILNPLLPHPISTFNCSLLHHILVNSRSLIILSRSTYLLTPISSENQTPWMVMAEEINPGKLQLRHPLTGKLLKHSTKTLDITQFEASELFKGYSLLHSRFSVINVLLSSKSSSLKMSSMNDLIAFVLYDYCTLGALRVGDVPKCNWDNLVNSDGHGFPDFGLDDIVSFKGGIVAVDGRGRLYAVDYKPENWLPLMMGCILVKDPICGGNRRKRLVVDPVSDRLYLVIKQELPLKLCLFVLDEVQGKWVIVKTLGRYRVLFAGVDNCFFAWARDFPGCPGSTIVFIDRAFPQYSEYRSIFCDGSMVDCVDEDESIQVYRLTANDSVSSLSDYPGLSQYLGPPPAWFSGLGRNAKDEEMQFDSNSQDNSASFREDIISDVQFEVAPKVSTDKLPTFLVRGSCTLNGIQARPEISRDEIRHSGFSFNETENNNNYTTVKFAELEVRSTLVRTLEKIWLKHGNILQKSVLCNTDILARAVESVATSVLILEGNSIRSLNEQQAHYLKSAMSDLRYMNLDIDDWLVPAIEKALALYKNKPLVDSLNCLSKAKAKAVETRSKLLAELANLDEMEQELDENISMVSKAIPISGELLDLDQPLVEGLT